MFAMIVKVRMEERERGTYCGVHEVGGLHRCVSCRHEMLSLLMEVECER